MEPDNNSSPLIISEQESDAEQTDYYPVSARRSVAVLVRYHVRGRGQPMPYPLEERISELRSPT